MPKKKTEQPIKCRVIKRKELEQEGTPCPNDAEFLFTITSPEDQTTVIARTLLCSSCSARFEAGHSLVVSKNDGTPLLIRAQKV